MASVKSETLVKRISVSVSEEERELFDQVCAADGRNGRAEIMWLVKQRAAEVLGK